MSATPSLRCLSARWIVPIRPADTVLEHHSLIIDAEKIIDCLPTNEAHQRYPNASEERFDQHVLLPGLINLHAHMAMTLLRGVADDLALMSWLQDHIWPLEGRWVREDFVYDGTLIAAAEMLKSGITCVNDMYFYPQEMARALLTAGLRGMVGATIIEFPTAYASTTDDYFSKGLQARDVFQGETLIDFNLAPHAPYTISDDTFRRVNTLAEQLDLPIHTHIHESQSEIDGSISTYGVRPLARLEALGLLSPRLIAAHGVHLTPGEIERLAHFNVSIAHNPSSNLKLASGIAPVFDLLKAGVNVGLGSDGAASNNRQDIFTEMRQAALLAKVSSGNPEALNAWQALEMATINGAQALGWDDKIGSLEAGKAADIIAIELNDLFSAPVYDPVSHLVYVCGREHVSDVWVNGRRRVAKRQLQGLDEGALITLAKSWQQKIRAR